MTCILVIDDDVHVRKLLRRVSEHAGHTVVEADDGRTALAKYTDNGVDVVITDLLMPEKDGLETIRILRRADPHARIIAISGGGLIGASGYLNMAIKMGAYCALEKPIDLDQLMAAVEQCMQDRVITI